MKITTKTVHKISAVSPRLSDEDLDLLEKDDGAEPNFPALEGWLPWDAEDIVDIRRLIFNDMPIKQRFVMDAFLDGLSYGDIDVTEKYWRYHFSKGIAFIKKALKL